MKAETSSHEVSTASNSLRENHSWHHVIKCRAVVKYENEVKSHANMHTHTKLNCGNYICNNWQRARHYQGQHKNQGYIIVYIIYAWTYVCNFCTLTHICCVHSLPWLTTCCLSSLFILENSLPKLPRDYTVNFVLVYPVNACM